VSTPEEDEAWRTIVENYGDRPDFPPASPPTPSQRGGPRQPAPRADQPPPAPVQRPRAEDEHPELQENDADHFVPQEVPPVALPKGRRGVAWAGLFGVPVLVVLSIALSIHLSSLAAFLLLAWFIGGFVYLVATMKDKPTDGWDDGAVL
jgi:hypothetical protein